MLRMFICLLTIASNVISLQMPVPQGRLLQRRLYSVKEKEDATPELIKRPTEIPVKEIEEKKEVILDVEVSQFDEFLIQWGLKEDPRVPEECRVSPAERIKNSGRAGVAAYALTELAFWITSVPLAVATVAYTTGSLPDVSTLEGKEAVAGYVFAFTTFARGLVPVRLALALAAAPWCDKNIIQKFFPSSEDKCEVSDS
mmetsp:Transcript_11908/g.17838  ORF Transcript_11908/g.17838 Transcript_11908/m.17838 type:complete len:199 (-) Transcript_11908:309-905(-)